MGAAGPPGYHRAMPEFTLRSPAGLLRARHDPPESAAPADGPRGALVCHPHPVQGGTMDNKVVVKLAQVLRRRGLHVVRFNFRGAGGSEGVHDQGRGERDDARSALDHLAGLVDGGPLLAAGFSFGAWVGLTAAADDDRVVARLAVAPPVNHYDFSAVAADPSPLAVIYAEADELVPADAVRAGLAGPQGAAGGVGGSGRPPALRAYPVAGAGHLFHAHLKPLADAAGDWLDGLAFPDGGPPVHSAP